MEEAAPDIVIFLGRFHPMILHLPIGFLIIAFLLEILSRFQKFRQYKPAIGFVLLLGASSGVLTAGLGYMLAQGGDYNEDLLSVHQWSGIVAVGSAVAALMLRRWSEATSSVVLYRGYISTMTVMVIALLIAGHFGGSITHGSDYMTQYMPNNLRILAGLPPKKDERTRKIINLNEAVIFTDIVFPILDARCTSCHNETKSKGGLKMHTAEDLLRGGENGPIFVMGNAEASEMIKRVHLPESNEDHMPPKGKIQLTDEEIQLLTWWINQGASIDKTVMQTKVNDTIQTVLDALVDPDAHKTEVEKLLLSAVSPADGRMLNQLLNEGVFVSRLSAEVHWLQAGVSQSEPGDFLMSRLGKISKQLTWLDLGGTSTTDKMLSSLNEFKNLTRLHLENTQVTDEGLKYLSDLPYLEYLNLFSTQVSDEGIQQLIGLKNLKELYLGHTQVTTKGASQLRDLLPGLKVNMGMEGAQMGKEQHLNASGHR